MDHDYELLVEKEAMWAKMLMEVLEDNGITPEFVIEKIAEMIGTGAPSFVTGSDMTPRLKKVIGNSLYEARDLGYNMVGTEHILQICIFRRMLCLNENYSIVRNFPVTPTNELLWRYTHGKKVRWNSIFDSCRVVCRLRKRTSACTGAC